MAVNTVSLFAAMKEAVKGWEEAGVKEGTFIYTGNLLNIESLPGMLDLGVGGRGEVVIPFSFSRGNLDVVDCEDLSGVDNNLHVGLFVL